MTHAFSPPERPTANPWSRTLALALLVSAGASTVEGAWDALAIDRAAHQLADTWDRYWDPIVIEDGVLRVEGPRRFVSEDGRQRVDPDDATPLETLPAGSTVFGSRAFTQVRPLDVRTNEYRDFQDATGANPIRVDTASLHAFWARWRVAALLGVAIFTSVAGALSHALWLGLVTAVAGWLLVLVSATSGLRFRVRAEACLRAALPFPLIWSALRAADASGPCLANLLLFAPLAAIGGFWLLRRAPPEPAPLAGG